LIYFVATSASGESEEVYTASHEILERNLRFSSVFIAQDISGCCVRMRRLKNVIFQLLLNFVCRSYAFVKQSDNVMIKFYDLLCACAD